MLCYALFCSILARKFSVKEFDTLQLKFCNLFLKHLELLVKARPSISANMDKDNYNPMAINKIIRYHSTWFVYNTSVVATGAYNIIIIYFKHHPQHLYNFELDSYCKLTIIAIINIWKYVFNVVEDKYENFYRGDDDIMSGKLPMVTLNSLYSRIYLHVVDTWINLYTDLVVRH